MYEPQRDVEGPVPANTSGGPLTDEQTNGLLLGCELIMEVLIQQSGTHDRAAISKHAQAINDLLDDLMPIADPTAAAKETES